MGEAFVLGKAPSRPDATASILSPAEDAPKEKVRCFGRTKDRSMCDLYDEASPIALLELPPPPIFESMCVGCCRHDDSERKLGWCCHRSSQGTRDRASTVARKVNLVIIIV